jgi:hypothetical protein
MPGRRRANGEGTITKRADGRYQAAYYVLDPQGHRVRKFVYARTREECDEKLTEMKSKTEGRCLMGREQSCLCHLAGHPDRASQLGAALLLDPGESRTTNGAIS